MTIAENAQRFTKLRRAANEMLERAERADDVHEQQGNMLSWQAHREWECLLAALPASLAELLLKAQTLMTYCCDDDYGLQTKIIYSLLADIERLQSQNPHSDGA